MIRIFRLCKLRLSFYRVGFVASQLPG